MISISESQIREVDGMLCDMIEYAKVEKEELISQGISQGITQGKLEKATEVAKNLLKMNIPLESIAEATGFTIQELERL